MTFNAPEAATAQQYEISLTVSDGELSSTTTYLLNVKAKAATPSQDEGTSGSYPAWSANSKYSAGDIVNNHGKLFQCKPFPYSGWCNNAPMYYEPGAGLAWSEAGRLCKAKRQPSGCRFTLLPLPVGEGRGEGIRPHPINYRCNFPWSRSHAAVRTIPSSSVTIGLYPSSFSAREISSVKSKFSFDTP